MTAARADVDSDFELSVQRAADARRCQAILRALPDASGGPSGFILCVSEVTEPARPHDRLHHCLQGSVRADDAIAASFAAPAPVWAAEPASRSGGRRAHCGP